MTLSEEAVDAAAVAAQNNPVDNPDKVIEYLSPEYWAQLQDRVGKK